MLKCEECEQRNSKSEWKSLRNTTNTLDCSSAFCYGHHLYLYCQHRVDEWSYNKWYIQFEFFSVLETWFCFPSKKDDVFLPFQGLGKSPWVMTTDRTRACRSTEWKIYFTLVRSELWAGSVVRHASLISQCWNIAFSFSCLESWNPTFF